MKFYEGDVVLAKYPSTDEYLIGKILSSWGERYKVLFAGGIEYTVHSNDIKVFFCNTSTPKNAL